MSGVPDYLQELLDALPEASEERDRGAAVSNSMDLDRVLRLPRRELVLDVVSDLTKVFKTPRGRMALYPIQSAALLEASLQNGLFAPMSVGAGKGLLSLLLPTAMDSKKSVLLIPPGMKRPLQNKIKEYSQHWRLPLDVIRIAKYTELSDARTAEMLDQINPDLVIADEAHNLRRTESARTKRFLRFFREHPAVRFAALSGTMTSRSLMDYFHLILLCLGKSSPMPLSWRESSDWSCALDVKPRVPMRPGALRKLADGDETPREGYKRRMRQTAGVVASGEDTIGTSLIIRRVPVVTPPAVMDLLNELTESWSLDGEEFDEALTLHMRQRQVAAGFYYKWKWPGDIPDVEWLVARANWHKFVREVCRRSRAGLDSPLLVARACERHEAVLNGKKPGPGLAVIDSPEWRAWKPQKDKQPPPTEAVWIDSYLCMAAIERAQELVKGAPTIIWCGPGQSAVGEMIAKIALVPYYGAGMNAEEATAPIIVCSIESNGTGKNLQEARGDREGYACNVFVSFPSGGKMAEQALGRTHRPGQLADEVIVEWLAPDGGIYDAAMSSAIADAQYVLDTTPGARQKLLYATHTELGA